MNDFDHTPARYCFGDFVLDLREVRLTCAGEPIELTPKEFETLRVLVTHAGHLVPKEELIRQVWPDTFVSDSSLLRNISVLRKHLGHDCIRTVSKRGYIFALAVTILDRNECGANASAEDVASRSLRPEAEPVNARAVDSGSLSDRIADARLESDAHQPLALEAPGSWPIRNYRRNVAILAAMAVIVAAAIYFELPRLAILRELRRSPNSTVATNIHESPEAARLCELAWFYRNKATAADSVKAIALFRQATNVDPNDAHAWAGLADSLFVAVEESELDIDRPAAMDEGQLAAQRALALGPNLPEVHMAAGTMYYQSHNFSSAEKEYREALRLNPNYGEAQYSYAVMLGETDRMAEAKVQFDKALELEPTSVRVLANAGILYAHLHLYNRALQLLRRAQDMNDEAVLVDGNLGLVLTMMHRYEQADAAFHQARQQSGTLLPYGAAEAFCLARTGHSKEAKAILAKILTIRRKHLPMDENAVAMVYAGLNEKQAAMEWLSKALAYGANPQTTADDPFFESLHGTPRFEQLIATYEHAPVTRTAGANEGGAADAR